MFASVSLAAAAAAAPGAPERAVHRFLEVALSPSGAFVATVEGDSPRSGRAPPVRELGVPTSSVIYAHEGHGLRDPEHLADLEQRVLGWFDRYLTR